MNADWKNGASGGGGDLLPPVREGHPLPLLDVLLALRVDAMGFVWHVHPCKIPLSEIGSVQVSFTAPGIALVIDTEGRVLGCGTSRVWQGACPRIIELREEARAFGRILTVDLLQEACRTDCPRALRCDTWRYLVCHQVHPQRLSGPVGVVGGTE
jgi:hypothetical protein